MEAIQDVQHGTHNLQISDMEVRVFGDAAVVTFEQDEKSQHGEEDFSGQYRFTNGEQ